MGNYPEGPGPVRLPPTVPPKRRRKRPAWVLPVTGGLVLVVVAIAVSSLLNNEVSRRLATVPPPTTAPPTTVTVAETTTVSGPQVVGERVRRSSVPPTSSTSTTLPAPAPEPLVKAATPSEMIAALEKLPVEDEHSDGYLRRNYGIYRDADNDGCFTPAEVAIAEGADVRYDAGCTLQSGTWFSPFDARTLTLPSDIDVDHLVSLRETWESGAWKWSVTKRNRYLNELENAAVLLVVSETSREERNDEDPKAWLPSNEPYRCEYLKSWVNLKTLYELSVDPGEREAIAAAALFC